MKLHNLMEDIVLEKVYEIFDEEAKQNNPGYCTCKQCRMDVVCFVLNRIQPQYMLSSRGLAHLRTDYQEDMQKSADLVRLINEGIQQVSSRRRSHTRTQPDNEEHIPSGPLYNFPTIVGRIFNGVNFEPLHDTDIFLLSESKPVKMIDQNWLNPYPIVEKTAGHYTFWPYPAEAESVVKKRVFEFELFIEKEGFDEFHHFFEIELTSDAGFRDSFQLQQTYTIKDLYIFPI